MMLLLGGFGHHVWHYGLPMSVAQLAAQLELHMFEGLGLVPEACSTDCRGENNHNRPAVSNQIFVLGVCEICGGNLM